VLECNDGYLNDLQALAVQPAHFDAALQAVSPEVAQGAVGAGGACPASASRAASARPRVAVGAAGQGYTVGALVLSNFGRLPELILAGDPLGARLAAASAGCRAPRRAPSS
jgi:D-aminopeptidase